MTDEDTRPDAKRVTTPSGEAWVVREEPLLIELAEGDRVLTMRTPGHDEELAVGFLLGEGILSDRAELQDVEALPAGEGPEPDEDGPPVDRVRVTLRPGVELGPVARERLSRAHAIRPSCGLCGLTSPAALARSLPELRPGPRVGLAELNAWGERMRAEQRTFQATGGSHAAAVFSAAGELWGVREDVGRHNALDKVLGRCVLDGRDLSQAVVILSGRGGYELVLKALRLRVPVVASVSAASSLAVELADEHGATLVGFLRDGGGRVYCDDERLREPAE
ncbi:MAG: formate dehydrogenase accessory sulfurtransferase FdhD [Planctomycetes bacterium]|nr:formate dehydrogenase accessory sulfurtransferase FdhD [Planctomycetota bacterium]